MTSQRKFTLIWLLLPLLVLRGLVPTGFMIDTSGSGLSMVICHGGTKGMAAGQHGEHSNHASSGEHDQRGEHSGNSICPFAAAAMGAPAPHLVSLALGVAVTDDPVTEVAAVQSLFGPSRAQQSRAPPYFS